MYGVLDVANSDIDELFDELAHFLFLHRLRVVLVQHLPQREKMSAETFLSICVPTHATTACLVQAETRDLEEKLSQVGRGRLCKELPHLFPFLLAARKQVVDHVPSASLHQSRCIRSRCSRLQTIKDYGLRQLATPYLMVPSSLMSIIRNKSAACVRYGWPLLVRPHAVPSHADVILRKWALVV